MNSRTIALTAALVLAGCTTNEKNSGLVIDHVVLGQQQTINNVLTCVFQAANSETLYPTFNPGQANTNFGLAGFVVKNQLTDPSTTNSILRTNSTTFSPHQAVVDYELVGANSSVAEQVIPVSSSAVPGNTLTAVAVPLFSPTAVQTALGAFTGFVRTTVRIEGRLDDGSTVSTSAHDYVVSICNNCPTSTCF